MGWFSSPESIDPTKVGNYFDQGGYVSDIGDMSAELMDPNSEYSQSALAQLRQQTQDSLFSKAMINRRQSAASGQIGQSGIFDQMQQQSQDNTYNQQTQAFNQMMGQNMDKGMGMLQSAAQFDLSKGEAMASAYGQNITNKNNYNAAMAGNVMNAASSLGSAAIMSDKRAKENIKKIGKAKTKDGKTVNIYSYNFKGSKNKKTGVIAQEVAKSHPSAVLNKQGKGMMRVNYKKLFG